MIGFRLQRLIVGIIITACVYVVYLGVDYFNDYMRDRPYTVETTQLYSGASGGKHSYMEFIGVFKTEDGILFDRRVSASTYSTLAVGDKVTFTLRPFDIQQTTSQNIWWFFLAKVVGTCIVFATGLLFIVVNPLLPEDF